MGPYPKECLAIKGHEKIRRNGLYVQSMLELDKKCKRFTQHRCPVCKMWVVWRKKLPTKNKVR